MRSGEPPVRCGDGGPRSRPWQAVKFSSRIWSILEPVSKNRRSGAIPDVRFRIRDRVAARRRRAVVMVRAARRALSGVARADRCGAGPDAWGARTHAGPGACPGFVRRTGIARRGLRRLAARLARQSNRGDQPGDRRCRRNDPCGCDNRASVRAGNELGCRDHARRHRRAARCFRSRGGIAPIEAAPPDPGRAGRRKPVQRRQRTARLSHRGRRGGDRQFFRLARSCPCSC